jgi:hypothetical protein
MQLHYEVGVAKSRVLPDQLGVPSCPKGDVFLFGVVLTMFQALFRRVVLAYYWVRCEEGIG